MRKGERMGLIIGLTVVGLGVGGAVVWQIGGDQGALPTRALEPAMSELGMFEKPGMWKQTGRLKYLAFGAKFYQPFFQFQTDVYDGCVQLFF